MICLGTRSFAYAVALLTLFAASGCDRSPAIPTGFALSAPTKDDVALINGVPLTLTSFEAIRSSLKNPNAQAAFWIGVGAIALQNQAKKAGKELSGTEALAIARYASGEGSVDSARDAFKNSALDPSLASDPAALSRAIDQIVSKQIVQRNARALADFQ